MSGYHAVSQLVKIFFFFRLFDESLWKSHDAVWYSFSLTGVDRQPMRTMATGDHQVHKFLKSHWKELIPPSYYAISYSVNKRVIF